MTTHRRLESGTFPAAGFNIPEELPSSDEPFSLALRRGAEELGLPVVRLTASEPTEEAVTGVVLDARDIVDDIVPLVPRRLVLILIF